LRPAARAAAACSLIVGTGVGSLCVFTMVWCKYLCFCVMRHASAGASGGPFIGKVLDAGMGCLSSRDLRHFGPLSLLKLHAHKWFFPPHHTARMARLVEIEDEIEGVLQDRFMNLQFGPRFPNIANGASIGETIGPDDLRAF
jgi:hypothetical protein